MAIVEPDYCHVVHWYIFSSFIKLQARWSRRLEMRSSCLQSYLLAFIWTTGGVFVLIGFLSSAHTSCFIASVSNFCTFTCLQLLIPNGLWWISSHPLSIALRWTVCRLLTANCFVAKPRGAIVRGTSCCCGRVVGWHTRLAFTFGQYLNVYCSDCLVCSIAYVTMFNVYRHYTQSFTAAEGAPYLV